MRRRNGAALGTTAVTLEWKRTSGAEHYELQWTATGDFSGIDPTMVPQPPAGSALVEHAPSALAAETAYQWRVRACSAAGCSAYSEAWSFSTEEPVLQRYYYLTDHLGSVRATANDDGAVVHYEDYYAFGTPMPGRNEVRSAEGESLGQPRFTAVRLGHS